LIAAATPATHDNRNVRSLFENFQPRGPLTRDDPLMIERRHHCQASGCGLSLSAREAVGGGGAFEDHFCTERFCSFNLD
jgi:hypothetical protein